MQERVAPLRPMLATGIIAGLIGAVLLDVYLIVTTVFIEHAAGIAAIFQSDAALLVGKTAALGNPVFVWLGLATHLGIGGAWGIGYTYVASRTPQVVARPFASGVTYGLIVYVAMQLMALAANIFTAPDALGFYNDIVAYTLFFGVPIAYFAGKRLHA
jgi:hypothetical protein